MSDVIILDATVVEMIPRKTDISYDTKVKIDFQFEGDRVERRECLVHVTSKFCKAVPEKRHMRRSMNLAVQNLHSYFAGEDERSENLFAN